MTETNTMDVIFVDYLLPDGTKKQRVTLKEFLALSQDQLTEQNQKVQKALGQLYQLNDREPPLFRSFPKQKKPLVIDCTPHIEGNFGAHYDNGENKVELMKDSLESTELYLLDTFAHELKHAEQYSHELGVLERDSDGLKYHQLSYLIEAQAFAFGSYVTYLFQLESSSKEKCQFAEAVYPILEKHTKGKSVDDFYDIQCEMMKEVLPQLYRDELYQFDDYQILKDDEELSEEDLPDSFHFKDSREALSLLKDMPRKIDSSSDWISKIPRVRKKHKEILNVIDEGSAETLKQLVENKLKSGEISSDELLTITKMAFIKVIYRFCHTDSFILKSNTNDVKDKVKFFLDLKVDGKPIMQEEDILSACVSDQKDVREAIKEYQKEHPDDKRFPENNGLLGATIGKSKLLAHMKNELNRKRALDEHDKFISKFISQNRANFIHRGIKDDPEYVKNSIKVKNFIKHDLDNRESLDLILKAIEIEFTRFVEEHIPDQQIQNSKDMLKFFLDLQVDGKPFMQEKDILNLLEGARASGRKDVEEAIHEYQKDHPNDMRFSENKGLLGATIGKGKRFAYRTAISSNKMVDKLNELSSQLAYRTAISSKKMVYKLNELSSQLNEFHLPISERRRLADYVHQGIKNDSENINWFVKHNLRRGFISPDRILKAIEIEFTRFVEKDASNEYIQNSKDMLKFFLDLEVDGKPVMQEKDITKLFKNARISGRKDVEEAMLEYKAEHPDDKRFSKEMFNSSSMDKVKEFKERQERKAAEVEAAAKNAANKDVSALTATIKAAKSK